MTVHLVPIHYDIKTSRAHLKRVRDLIAYPPTMRYLESETLVDVVDNQKLDNHDISPEESTEDRLTAKIDVDIDSSVPIIVNDSDLEKADDVKECNKTEKMTVKGGVCVDVNEVMKEVSVHEEGFKGVVESHVVQLIQQPVVLRAEAPVWMPIIERSKETVELVPVIVTGSINEESSSLHVVIKEPSTEIKTGESTTSVEVQEVEIGGKVISENLSQLAAETVTTNDVPEVLNVDNKSVDAEITHTTVSTTNVSVVRAPLPTIKEIFAKPLLGSFFTESLLNTVSASPPSSAKSLSQCVKSASLSGWNPPPPARRIQGDLLYIEVVTEEVYL
jgi:hypothetical protein